MLKNDKKDKKPHAKGYYHFNNQVEIDGKTVPLFVFFEVDENGVLHYDFMIKKEKAVFDGTDNCPTITNCGIEPVSKKTAWDNDTVIFDDSSSSYVLNLFLFDANDNEVSDKNQSNTDEIQSFLNDFKNDISHSVEEESQLERLQGVAEQLDTNHVHYPLLKGETYPPMVIETIGKPLDAPYSIMGDLWLEVPITLETAHSLDYKDLELARAGALGSLFDEAINAASKALSKLF